MEKEDKEKTYRRKKNICKRRKREKIKGGWRKDIKNSQ